jgi:uncharacterized protein (TIGR00304 family)
MNKYYLLSLSLVFFSIGIVFFIIAFINNEVEFGFFLFFPFIIGSGIYSFFGFIFVLITIILLFFGFVNLSTVNSNFVDYETINNNTKKSLKKSIKFGELVFIGPIPIVIGSNWKISLIIMVLGILILVIIIMLFMIL